MSLAALAGFVFAGVAGADSPSDDRATFHDGNVTTCEGAGFGDSIQMGSESNTSNSDANVSGTVKTNAGLIQPGQGDEVNITLLTAGTVIDAVIVKGGNGYNVYSDSDFLPPTLLADQHYISPLNNGGNVPAISHWFVCYHTEEVETGSLVVTKTVVQPPAGSTPLVPLPNGFTATVNCDDGVHTNIAVTFGPSGGAGSPASITGIEVGTKCTVVESALTPPPGGPTVTYTPVGANVAGVTIADSTTPVAVNIRNDFSGVTVQAAAVAVVVTPTFTG